MATEKELLSMKKNPRVLEIYSSHIEGGLKKDQSQWLGCCPFGEGHSDGKDSNPSFGVYKLDDDTYGYKCFSCGANGNVFQFVCKLDKLTFTQAVERVGKFLDGTWEAGKDDVEGTFRPVIPPDATYTTFPISACDKFVADLKNSSEAATFLKGRGLTVEAAAKLQIGYRKSLPEDMRLGKKGEKEYLRHGGWLLFPYVIGDKVVRIKARSIMEKYFTQMPGMQQIGLFNSNVADPLQPLFLVEGELDAVALTQAGFNVVSLFNATHNVTAEDKDILMTSSELYLAGDFDGGEGEKKMLKLSNELQGKTYLLRWPDGIKDANDFLRKFQNPDDFKRNVEHCMETSRGKLIHGIYSLQDVLLNSDRTDLTNHPDRVRFPWKSVDSMAICLPGSVITVTASSTGMGKSQFLMNTTIAAAREQNEVVLNYQAEMSPDEIGNMVVAHVLQKDRNDLKDEDYKLAARTKLKDITYYIGNNNDLQTSTQVLDLIELAIRRYGPTIVVLDHLHHVCQNVKNEIQDQSNAMKRIKSMAQKYAVKFFVVGQPRKADTSGRGKEIYMSDIKGSEVLASASDAVFILHRNQIRNYDTNHPPMDIFEPQTKVTLHKGRTKGRGAAVANLILRGTIATFVDEQELLNGENNSQKEETLDQSLGLIK